MRDGIDLGGEMSLPFPDPPAPGETVAIAPRLHWARMPLPLRLNHVNVWLMEEADGWTVVDCGLNTAETRAAWEALFTGSLRGRPIRRLVATHGHVDHIGLSGWLTSRYTAPFFATREAWLWARLGHARMGRPPSAESLSHLKAHGCDPEFVEAFAKDREPVLQLFAEQPQSLIRVKDGDALEMGGVRWDVHTADGHADEHATFHSDASGILIAGDQILQRISPVVGVFGSEPLSDPLTDYLGSLPFYEALPPHTLVLPSHGLPFYGLQRRIKELQRHHEERLGQAMDALDKPRTATECAHVIFERAMAEGQWFLALAETLAHLHRLVTLKSVVRDIAADGVIRFAKA